MSTNKKLLMVGCVIVVFLFLLGMVGGGIIIYNSTSNDTETNEEQNQENEGDNDDVEAEEENPVTSQFVVARNTQRNVDANVLLMAIFQYTLGNNGTLPSEIELCTSQDMYVGTGSGNVDLAETLVPTYLASMPYDPSEGDDENTGYTVCHSDDGVVTVSAPYAEGGETISVSR